MNVKMLDQILFWGAVASLLVGVLAVLAQRVWLLTPQGWWRGSVGLAAIATVCLLMQIRDAVQRKS